MRNFLRLSVASIMFSVAPLAACAQTSPLVDLDRSTSQSGFPIEAGGKAAAIYVAPGNPETVRIAVEAFASDVERVTGVKPQVLTSLAASTPEAPARRAGVHGPWPLVSLAGLGTVTWRCDPSRRLGLGPALPGLALGFRASRADKSGLARLRSAGRLVSERAFQPGDVIDFPYLPSRVQQVEIAESGEDGTLRAFVRVDFAPRAVSGYCWPYMPPATSVRLLARR